MSQNDKGLSILKASYGTAGNFTDVTKEVQGLVNNGELDFVVSAQSLGILDPAPGVKKTLQVQHTINGGRKNLDSVDDGNQLKLSVPNVKTQANQKYNIISYLFQSLLFFLIGFLAIESMHAGKLIFGSTIGWLFFALTLITFGHFSSMLIFILLIAGWLLSSTHVFPQ